MSAEEAVEDDETGSPAAQHSSPSSNAPMRVLLVEDDAITRNVVAAQLARLHFEVELASSGREALVKMKSLQPDSIDAILTDEMMPNMTGTELAKAVSSTEWNSTPVFLMSSEVNEGTRRKAAAAGVLATFSKPVQSSLFVLLQHVHDARKSKQPGESPPSPPPRASGARAWSDAPAIKREMVPDQSQGTAKRARHNPLQPDQEKCLRRGRLHNMLQISRQERAARSNIQEALQRFPGPSNVDMGYTSLLIPNLANALRSPLLANPEFQIRPLDVPPPRREPHWADREAREALRSSPSTDTHETNIPHQDLESENHGAQLLQPNASLTMESSKGQPSNSSNNIQGSQKQAGRSNPQLHLPVFPSSSGLLQAHQQRFNDSYQAVLKQHRQAEVCTANRQAAIMRFRAKRKQRSFEKKVRYASRKRLAEQRPRIRGQFVKAADLHSHQAEADKS